MKNTDKSKKRFLIMGLSSLCVVMLIVLAAFTLGGKDKDPDKLVADNTPPDVSIADIPQSSEPIDTPQPTDPVKVADIPKQDEPTSSHDPVLKVDEPENVEVDLTDISKPEPPPTPEITHPSEKPDTTVPKPTDTPTQKPPAKTDPPSNAGPKPGDKKDGQVYVEGFGWIKDEGGGAKGEVADSDGDINKQVGIMGGN